MNKGKFIKELRRKLRISQVELAKSIGVSKQTLYKYENNIITNIPSDKIEALAAALHTDPSVIMGWESETNNDCTSRSVLSPDESSLLEDYRVLNDDGREQARMRVHELTELRKYVEKKEEDISAS